MKVIPWKDLAWALEASKHGSPAARELLAEHVSDFVAEAQARALPSRGSFDAFMAGLRERHSSRLPKPATDAPVPQSHHDTDTEDDA